MGESKRKVRESELLPSPSTLSTFSLPENICVTSFICALQKHDCFCIRLFTLPQFCALVSFIYKSRLVA